MLKDNFKFIENEAKQHTIIEKNFWKQFNQYIEYKFKKTSKDGNITPTRQGNTGNCWILAGINSLSYCKAGKQFILKSLEYKTACTIVHTICGDYVVLNSELESAKTNSMYSNGDDDMIILELAFEKIIDDYANKRIRISKNTNYLIKRTLKTTPSTKKKSSTHLGHPGACFYFLTGLEPKLLTSQTKIKEYLSKFHYDCNKYLAISAISRSEFSDEIKDIYNKKITLHKCHAYSVKEVNGNQVTITNPHNSRWFNIISIEMFLKMFSNIQVCDLSSKRVREYFTPKIYYNKLGKIEKTIETDEKGYHIQYEYFYDSKGKLTKAKCSAQHSNGLYVICICNFVKKENWIENGNTNTKISLMRHYKDKILSEMHFGKINEKTGKKPPKIPINIGQQIQEYTLYQYENLDTEKILSIAKDMSNGNFDSAFLYCK